MNCRTPRRILVLMAVLLLALTWMLVGCASGSGGGVSGSRSETGEASRPGTRVAALELVATHENVTSAYYYPLERLAGCTYSPDFALA